jgi:hypothetical protein
MTRLMVAAGPRSLSYPAYDARGHAGRSVDGPNDLSFTFDAAERVTAVYPTGSPGTPLKQYTYDTLGGSTRGWSLGKLVESVAHNALASGPDATVTQTLAYGGVAGAVSERQTTLGYPEPETFTQDFTWTDLGALASETYPSGAGVGSARSVMYAYDAGYLTGVSQQVGSAPETPLATLTYQPNGMVATVAHSNGVIDTIAADPDAMARPRSLSTSGAVDPITRAPANCPRASSTTMARATSRR